MALSNREIVGKGLDLLRSGLRPFVEREYRRVYGEEWVTEAGEVLKGDRASLQDPDAQALLKLMDYRWNEVFDEKLTARCLNGHLVDNDGWLVFIWRWGLPGSWIQSHSGAV